MSDEQRVPGYDAPVQEPEANTTETEQNIAEQQETEITQTVAPAPEPEVAPAEPMSDTMKLLIGNAVILFLLLVGIIWWRRQTASAVPAGDLI